MSAGNVEIAKRVTDAYNQRDVDTVFAELATPGFEWWPALTRAYEGGCYRGREGAERFAAATEGATWVVVAQVATAAAATSWPARTISHR
jgi:hypothetical protein